MTPSESVYRALFKEEIAKGEKCWHEWAEYADNPPNVVGTQGRDWCPHCDKIVWWGKGKELNPDYSTPSGFFELKAELLKREKLWIEFKHWLIHKHNTASLTQRASSNLFHYVFFAVIRTPTTFLTAVHDFLKEKGEI